MSEPARILHDLHASIGSMSKKLVDFVIDRNAEQSAAFCDASERLWRQRYRLEHPTEIVALKCMDGRLNLAVMTNTPPGIIQPFRNIGGRFDIGWPFFGELVREWVDYATQQKRLCLMFVTYHYSKGDGHRGCKGFNYETDNAKQAAMQLAGQIEGVYGKRVRIVHPIVVGLETDDDSLVFHGEGEPYVVADHLEDDLDTVHAALSALYPSMQAQMLKDLLPLVEGNQRRVHDVRAANRPPIELDHREQIIAVGRGFDWLHLPNRALIVGPYDHQWPDAVATAGSIVLDNIRSGRVPEAEGALLLVSALSRDERGSYGWNTAVEKAKYLERVAKHALESKVPELAPHMGVLSGVMEASTRLFYPLK